jgi:hypothetical protein
VREVDPGYGTVPGDMTALPCPDPSPEPDCCPIWRQAGSVGRRADHEVTPEALWTASGWRGYSYGGFGGGHPHFHPGKVAA